MRRILMSAYTAPVDLFQHGPWPLPTDSSGTDFAGSDSSGTDPSGTDLAGSGR
ncbi:hypothetical protein [Streptomyces sp. NPDC020965]|uniref:hypothetical protein n=1 Tax=Streptomyces sp. NPDC020965 TaxID=3365105 RepID=UPI0037BD14E4